MICCMFSRRMGPSDLGEHFCLNSISFQESVPTSSSSPSGNLTLGLLASKPDTAEQLPLKGYAPEWLGSAAPQRNAAHIDPPTCCIHHQTSSKSLPCSESKFFTSTESLRFARGSGLYFGKDGP